MKRRRLLIILSFFSCVLIGLSSTFGIQNKEYFVRNVIDGDTIELSDGEKVRYIGIDTSETMKKEGRTWIYNPEEFSQEAMDFNRRLVLGEKVRLEFDVVKRDKYNRLLAYVYTPDNVMVNREVVRNGYSMVYTIPPNVRYVDSFLKAQEEARQERRGLWGALDTISPDDAHNYIGKWKRVKGKVAHIALSPYKIYIKFGYDRKTSLSAVIYANNLPFFTKKGIDATSDYKDKIVEVVGKIEYQNGLEMVIDNPSQISIIGED